MVGAGLMFRHDRFMHNRAMCRLAMSRPVMQAKRVDGLAQRRACWLRSAG